MVTASSSSDTNNRNRRRQNPFSRGVFMNCRDFWCDPAPYFGKRMVGDAMLGGEIVNYARMYDVPLRTTGRGMRYQEVGGGGEEVEVEEGV
jgi:palmitoyltransferase ZDHHC13/17